MERVGGEHRGVTMRRSEAAELGLDLIRPDPGGLQDRCTLGQLGDRGGGGRARRAALAVEADALDPASAASREIRTRSPQGAPPAEPVKAPAGAGPAAAIVGEYSRRGPVHALKLRRLQPAVFRPGLVTRVA